MDKTIIKAIQALRTLELELESRLDKIPELKLDVIYMSKLELYQKAIKELHKDL